MDILKYAERAMSMDDEVWRRHANPWSVYTRFSVLPLLSLAFWSREWIGGYSIIPVVLSLCWIWLNPRFFKAPDNTNNWASMGTFGERIYLNRKHENIPKHHIHVCRTLQQLSAMGLPILIYGLYELDIWALLIGNFWVMVFKAWFVDRMVWLYLDMRNTQTTLNPTEEA
ncbi:DUF6653 family protein [Marinomonas fungiae]|uniref:Uncharacterized protein n=1 Tax=Marinomonas fungiae TaxID=1137284 RepID=A0A0K6IHY2_9GAMM|nr:DUF6653 family protein [Marinomonas fungiae]CUB02671.1 hypothetical protein Ga0061065_1028 [Marinomonas fungiae]